MVQTTHQTELVCKSYGSQSLVKPKEKKGCHVAPPEGDTWHDHTVMWPHPKVPHGLIIQLTGQHSGSIMLTSGIQVVNDV
jgi:hypothetical protein